VPHLFAPPARTPVEARLLVDAPDACGAPADVLGPWPNGSTPAGGGSPPTSTDRNAC